jgi:hypothetical protein
MYFPILILVKDRILNFKYSSNFHLENIKANFSLYVIPLRLPPCWDGGVKGGEIEIKFKDL